MPGVPTRASRQSTCSVVNAATPARAIPVPAKRSGMTRPAAPLTTCNPTPKPRAASAAHAASTSAAPRRRCNAAAPCDRAGWDAATGGGAANSTAARSGPALRGATGISTGGTGSGTDARRTAAALPHATGAATAVRTAASANGAGRGKLATGVAGGAAGGRSPASARGRREVLSGSPAGADAGCGPVLPGRSGRVCSSAPVAAAFRKGITPELARGAKAGGSPPATSTSPVSKARRRRCRATPARTASFQAGVPGSSARAINAADFQPQGQAAQPAGNARRHPGQRLTCRPRMMDNGATRAACDKLRGTARTCWSFASDC